MSSIRFSIPSTSISPSHSISIINFFWDDGDDIWEFRIIVPENVSEIEVAETLKKEHEYLDMEDEEDIYGVNGRNPVTLLDYICEKYGWSWSDFEFDIDLNFN